MEKSKLGYFDAFSGIGGWALGAFWAGIRFNDHCFSEIDPYAIRVYQKHFSDARPLGDISKIDSALFRSDQDMQWVFSGSFPCLGISGSGKRMGLRDARSGLWSEYLRLIKEVHPVVFMVENVGDLAIRGLDEVISGIYEAGYECVWRVMYASDVGAPHLRERLWIIGYPRTVQSGENVDLFSVRLVRRIASSGRSVMKLEPVKYFEKVYVGQATNDGQVVDAYHKPVGRNMPKGGYLLGAEVFAVPTWERGLDVKEILEDTDNVVGRLNAQGDCGGSTNSGGAEEVGALSPAFSARTSIRHEDVANTDSARQCRHILREKEGVRGSCLGCEPYSELEGAWDVKPEFQCMVNGVPWYVDCNGQPIPFPVTLDKGVNDKKMLSCYGNAILPQLAWVMWQCIKPLIAGFYS